MQTIEIDSVKWFQNILMNRLRQIYFMKKIIVLQLGKDMYRTRRFISVNNCKYFAQFQYIYSGGVSKYETGKAVLERDSVKLNENYALIIVSWF